MNITRKHDPGLSEENNRQQDDNTSTYVLTFEVFTESVYHSAETLVIVPNITKLTKNFRSFFLNF
jgi:negative regulator of genetic competence, sporulation and motility